MHKKIFLFAITLFIANNLQSAEQAKSSHYQLQYHALHTTRPAHSFVEPIISCDISPSSMQIQHAEMYYMVGNNQRHVTGVTSTVLFSSRQYESIIRHVKNKQLFYIECHNQH